MSAPEQAVLRFKKEDHYGNTGTRFRIFEFLADCPEVPVTRHDVSPAHAIEGDELWIEDDDSTPYKLKRDGREIGAPEHWLVGSYVLTASLATKGEPKEAQPAGLLEPFEYEYLGKREKAWGLLDGDGPWQKDTIFTKQSDGRMWAFYNQRAVRALWNYEWTHLIEADQRKRDPRQSEALGAISATEGSHSIEVASETIPGTPVEAGDFLMIFSRSDEPKLPQVRGRIVPLTLEHYERIREAFKAPGRIREGELPYWPIVNLTPSRGFNDYYNARDFFTNRGKWGLRRQTWTSRAFVVKPLRRSALWAVSAPSELAAIFELVSQAGGRLSREAV